MKQNNKTTLASIILISMSIIWGLAYVGVQDAINHGWGPFAILLVRTLLGGCAILPFTIKKGSYNKRGTFIGGAICGLLGFIALALQTYGQRITTVSSTSFITALYVVFVPILTRVIFKTKEPWLVYLSCVISIIGCFLLNLTWPLSINIEDLPGNLLVLLSAVFFALQILAISYYSKKYSVLELTVVELFFMAFYSLIMMSITNDFSISTGGLFSLIWVGLLSSGLCSVFQMFGQKYLPESTAGILMSLESVFGTLFAVIIFKEKLSWIQIVGSLLIIAPVIICEVSIAKAKKKEEYLPPKEDPPKLIDK